ncbi:MAG TPA: zinc metallopeptidase [Clostridia bacterium]|nr:zinc metallopeptidase [Clostridia bacterium]
MTMLILFIFSVALSLTAQVLVQARFQRYSRVLARSGYTGFKAARRMLDENGMSDVRIERAPGQLTDHFSPREGILRLSDATYGSQSVAAIGVAAHETGHAMQHRDGYLANKIRSALLVPANIGSQAGPLLAVAGLVLQSALGDTLAQVGMILFAGSVLFYLVTLPVECNASRRALVLLDQTGILAGDEMKGAKSVLWAAALTYIASALTAVLYLLRFIGMAGSRRRR